MLKIPLKKQWKCQPKKVHSTHPTHLRIEPKQRSQDIFFAGFPPPLLFFGWGDSAVDVVLWVCKKTLTLAFQAMSRLQSRIRFEDDRSLVNET